MILSVKLGKGLMWQTLSPSCSWSTVAGPAGRRHSASFIEWLARSFAQRGISDRKWVADSSDAACLRDWVSVVEQGSAAHGLVGDVEMFEGTDERASQRRCLELGHEVTSDAGAGLAARPRN
jgi:hypothetical protein